MASYVHSAWMRTKDIRVFVPIYCGRRWLLVRIKHGIVLI